MSTAPNINFLLSIPMPTPLMVLILEYANLYDTVRYDCTITQCRFNFFNSNQNDVDECQQAMMIGQTCILNSAPLDKLENQAKINLNALLRPISTVMKVNGITFTLQGSPLQLAIILLDQTIMSATHVNMAEMGQAEKQMEIIANFIPERLAEARKQIRIAAFIEDEKTCQDKEGEQFKILNAMFNKIKVKKFEEARNIIWNYIIRTKPAVMTNNQYFLDLLQLTQRAFNLLYRRCSELKGGEYGRQADEYCFIIGMIQAFLPLNIRRVLDTGLYLFLDYGTPSHRRNVKTQWRQLGDHSFIAYKREYTGLRKEMGGWICIMLYLEKLHKQLHQCNRTYAAIEDSAFNGSRCIHMQK